MFRMHIRDGFEGQKHYVVPRQFLRQIEHHPLLHGLYPTDIGWYPSARYHYRERDQGAPENILIYCVDGWGWAKISGQELTIQSGHALVIPSDVPHMYSTSLEAPWSIHWVHFRGETAYQFVRQLNSGQYIIPVHPKAHTPIVETFQECYEALTAGFSMSQMIFCALAIHRILAWLFFANPAFQPHQLQLPTNIQKVLLYMQESLTKRLSLADMAACAGLSISHFSYMFRAYLGVSPIDYFIHLKMQYACHYLETCKRPIREIAFELGYDDPYYFSRLFHKTIGMPPSQYRENSFKKWSPSP